MPHAFNLCNNFILRREGGKGLAWGVKIFKKSSVKFLIVTSDILNRFSKYYNNIFSNDKD